MKAKLFLIFLVAVFAFPFLALIYYFRFDLNLSLSDLVWALKNSMLQSFLSASIATSVGFYFSFGLLTPNEKWQGLLGKLSLVPIMLPSLFSILIGYAILDPFPVGHIGVIFIFTLIHTGFAAVMIRQALQSQIGNYGLIASVYNLSRWQFIFKIFLPLIRSQLLVVFILIFLNCFSSLSVPLIAGGGKGTNIEVLIYEKIFIDGNWAFATTISLLQNFFLILIGLAFVKDSGLSQRKSFSTIGLRSRLALVGLLAYLLTYGGFYIFKVLSAFSWVFFQQVFDVNVWSATKNSLIVALIFMALFKVLSALLVYLNLKNISYRWLTFLLSPSSVLIGFSLYLVFPIHTNWDFFKIAYGLFLLSVMSLYKSYLEPKLQSLQNQLVICRTYQIPFVDVLYRVVWPQIQSQVYFVSSLIFLIAMSDFALVKASGAQIPMMGTLIESYLSSYRMSGALLLSFYVLVLWFGYYLTLKLAMGITNVLNSKS